MATARLYHSTVEIHIYSGSMQAEDLVPGLDGLLHCYHGYNRALQHKYPIQIEAVCDIDLIDMPQLPDLRCWNPFQLADSCRKADLISTAEHSRIAPLQITSEMYYFDPIEEFHTLSKLLRYEGLPYGCDLETLASDFINENIDDHDQADNVTLTTQMAHTHQACRAFRDRLFALLISKGIRAFRYQNVYEYAGDEQWMSVAIIDTSILHNAPAPQTLPEPGSQPGLHPF